MLAKFKLNSIEALISMPLIDSVISHDDIVLINSVLRECTEMKKDNRSSDLATRTFIEDFSLLIIQSYPIV